MHDEFLPQPPPGVPAPPPGEEALRSQGRFRKIIGLGILAAIVTILSMVVFFGPGPRKLRMKGDLITATSNANQIGLALSGFEAKYGKFPDASTALAVKADTGSTWLLSDSTSNDLFQQLFVAGVCDSEEIFYAKTPWSKKADNVRSSEATMLAARECAFAYIVGLSSKIDPQTPVCVTPLIPGKLIFDREPFDGRALILRADQSVATFFIDPSGHVNLNGIDIFDPRQPFWHGKAPTVKWPK